MKNVQYNNIMEIKFRKKREEVREPVSEDYISVGLDIGTTKVVVFVGKRVQNSDKVEILGQGETISVGVQRGQVINIAQTVTAIAHAIKQACAVTHLVIEDVVVGIAGQHINSFHSKQEIKRKNPDNLVSAEDVRQLIDEVFMVNVRPGTKIIDAIPQEFFVDEYHDLVDPIGVTGTQLGSDFNIITGSDQHIRNVIRCVKQCDLKMDGLILEPLASAAVVLDAREKESGVALVDIGGGTTDLAIFHNGILRHTAVIPIGGDVITDDIKNVFKGIVKEDAERIKKEYGTCVKDTSKEMVLAVSGIKGRPAVEIKRSELTDVILARLDEIIARIMEEIRNSGYAQKLGCGIVLTGGGSLLQNIKPYMEFQTGMCVRIGLPEEGIVFNEDTKHKYNNPIYSTALGLMLMGVERNDIRPMDDEQETPAVTQRETSVPEQEPKQRGKDGSGSYTWNKVKEVFANFFIPDEGADDDDEGEPFR